MTPSEPLSEQLRRIVWAFPAGDDRRADVHALADKVLELERNQAHARGFIAGLVGGVAATVVVLELERFAGWFPYVRVLLSFATLCASLRLLLLELARRRR